LAKERVGYCGSKGHKPWFDEKCSKLVDQRKQTKLQCLQDPSEVNADNLSNVRWEISSHFRNKKGEYFKEEMNVLGSDSGNKNIKDLYRSINEFKKVCQSRNKWVKDEGDVLFVFPHNILYRCKNYFHQLLNVHGLGGVRQTETHS
jgi:hypothetical protein